jgi:hypothetical protein
MELCMGLPIAHAMDFDERVHSFPNMWNMLDSCRRCVGVAHTSSALAFVRPVFLTWANWPC